MSDSIGPNPDITEEAVHILDAAGAEGIPLRLLGGLAIYLQRRISYGQCLGISLLLYL